MVFDGGWRILSGQVPFKDFLMAFGPLSFALQALFFKLLGVNWTATVIPAALLGALAALSVMRSVSLLFGKRRIWIVLLSGVLVGTSFQAMFGTLFMEQVGFFFCLLGIQAICESTHSNGRWRFLYLGMAGVLAVLAFLSKQNVGALTLALLGLLTLLVALSEPWEILRSVAAFAAGVAVAAGLFLLWLVLFSDPHLFLRHAIEVPMQLGRGRLPTRDLRYLPFFLQAATTTGWCYAVALGAAFQGVVLLCADRDFRRVFMATPTDRLALGLSLLIPFVQRLFEVTTLNQRENIIFLSGFALAMGTGLFCRLPAPSERHRLWIPLLACIIGGYLLFEMMEGSRNRIVHDVFPSGARTLFRGLRTPQLASIWWIQPTRPGRRGGPDLKPGEIDAVCKYLSSQQQDFLFSASQVSCMGSWVSCRPSRCFTFRGITFSRTPIFHLSTVGCCQV